MALTICPSCEASVSADAAACPKCGHPMKKGGGLDMHDPVHVIGVVGGILLLLMFLWGVLSWSV